MPMSGTALLMKPVPLAVSEIFYATAIEKLGLESATPSERITALTTLPSFELLQKFGQSVHALATVDDELLFGSPNHTAVTSNSDSYPLPATSWCESLLIGDCAFDGNILSLFIGHRKTGIASAFTSHIRGTLPSSAAEKILEIYNITSDSSDDDAFAKILDFGNDVAFYLPTLSYATAFTAKATKTYMYRFNATNPWEGPWKGKSNHIIDVTFLFQNYNAFLDEGRQKTAEAFGEAFLKWVNGKEPWEAWTAKNGRAMVFEDTATKIVPDTPEETGRRGRFLELVKEVGEDVVDGAWGGFLRG